MMATLSQLTSTSLSRIWHRGIVACGRPGRRFSVRCRPLAQHACINSTEQRSHENRRHLNFYNADRGIVHPKKRMPKKQHNNRQRGPKIPSFGQIGLNTTMERDIPAAYFPIVPSVGSHVLSEKEPERSSGSRTQHLPRYSAPTFFHADPRPHVSHRGQPSEISNLSRLSPATRRNSYT